MDAVIHALMAGVQHHQANRLQDAERAYRHVLAIQPNNPDALHLLGLIAHQVGQHAVAVETIGRAIVLNATVAEYHNNLGVALYALGKVPEAGNCFECALRLRPDYAEAHCNLGNVWKDRGARPEASACYRQALALKPDFPQAHNNLGLMLLEERKFASALACFGRAIELAPQYAEAHSNLGIAHSEAGNLDEAVQCYQRALALRPDYAIAHNNLGNALKNQGKYAEAVASFQRALQLRPDYAEAHNNLGNVLWRLQKPDQAAACYLTASSHKPDYAEAHSNLGNALRDQGRFDEALVSYQRALELKPDFADAHSNLGCALQELGDLEAAEVSFRTALRHDPRCDVAYFHLANLLGEKLVHSDLDALVRLLESGGLSDAQRVNLHFAMGHVLDRRHDYAGAARHFERGNALQLAEWQLLGRSYDPGEHARTVTDMIRVCTPEFFECVRGFGLESEAPVFIFGLPRSGTTMVEQILASHSEVFGAGEIKLTRDAWADLGGANQAFVEGLARLDREAVQSCAAHALERLQAFCPAARRIVDKTPDSYCSLGLLAILFPRAKYIHCRRDARDVALSCWMTRFHEVTWASDPHHIGARLHEHERMMAHWRQVLPVPVLEVNYEDIVNDLERTAQKLIAWCGLDWQSPCAEFHKAKRPVRTASLIQVRQPVYKTSVGRWQNYAATLSNLFAGLEGNSRPQTLARTPMFGYGQSGASQQRRQAEVV